jgi:hypothetical protein
VAVTRSENVWDAGEGKGGYNGHEIGLKDGGGGRGSEGRSAKWKRGYEEQKGWGKGEEGKTGACCPLHRA